MYFSRFTLVLGFPVFALANGLKTCVRTFHDSLSYELFALCVDEAGQNISTALDLVGCTCQALLLLNAEPTDSN
jgi:hypothetical protein